MINTRKVGIVVNPLASILMASVLSDLQKTESNQAQEDTEISAPTVKESQTKRSQASDDPQERERAEHNSRIDARKAEKKAKKLARKK